MDNPVGHFEKLERGIRQFVEGQSIRGSQQTHSRAENTFKARALDKGWRVHRPSWPDFLIERDKGWFAVEVKSKTDHCSREQIKTFDALERLGVKVFLWREAKPDILERWKRSGPRSSTAPGRQPRTPVKTRKGTGLRRRTTTKGAQ